MKRSLVAVLSAIALAALSAAPASAQISSRIPPHAAGVVFQGSALVGPGIGAPITVTTAPTPSVGVRAGDAAAWSFSISIGVGYHYQPPDQQPQPTPSPPNPAGAYIGAATSVAGSVAGGVVESGTFGYGAWCGYSSGRDGAGSIAFAETRVPPPDGTTFITVDRVGWIQSAATIIVFHGRVIDQDSSVPVETGTIDGIVSAIPTTGSCIDGSATGFTIVGAAIAGWQTPVT